MKFILGKKIGMTQIFKQGPQAVPVTAISAGPVLVVQLKTKAKDGYQAIVAAYEKKNKKEPKEQSKNKKLLYKYFREYKIENEEMAQVKVGDILDVSQFEEGNKVKITGISKGKGFQGGVKRWGFSGGPATHGHRHNQRGLGSVGCRYPQRVLKGKKMPGRMGSSKTTIKNLEIVKIIQEENVLLVKGAVAGVKGRLVEIRG